MHTSIAFHLDGIKKIDERNPNIQSFKNDTIFPLANHTHNLTETTTSVSRVLPENEHLTTMKSNSEKPSVNKGEMKFYEKPWLTKTYTAPEKSSNPRNIVSHPKRESPNHQTWHKISKDLHKFGSVNNAKENSFNGLEVVVLDVPSSYQGVRWDKPRMHKFPSPAFHYVPVNPAPSIFDLLLGLNSISQDLFTEPAEVENEIYIQKSLENPYWNHRGSFGKLLNTAAIHPKNTNSDWVRNDKNPTHLFGNLSEPVKNCTCTCGERNTFP